MAETKAPLTTDQRNQIILAAINMSGAVRDVVIDPADVIAANPDLAGNDQQLKAAVASAQLAAREQAQEDWKHGLNRNLKQITVLLNDQSSASKIVDMIHNAKPVMGVLLYVTKEASSTRGFIGLKTRESKWAKDGIETARTERTDTSPEALEFCRQLRALIGHRVLVRIDMQEYDGGKLRVAQHVEDLGPAKDFDPAEGKELTMAKLNSRDRD
ncbi:hypothetical protein V6N00_12825 [Tersicoccus sp. MR15.9]|uniref:hypothetical protein n=1 Tax=Tersicoccus mangrovi TaxID=3121635 RepID=UPI002FE69448